MQIDKDLPFLNGYVQQSIENGAQPYIPENERSGFVDLNSFRTQEQHEASTHSLRFEAYELPKPVVPSKTAAPITQSSSSSALVPVPEPLYHTESYQAVRPVSSSTDLGPADLRLKLDGVQKKWGKPSYSTPSSSNADNHTVQNGASQHVAVTSPNSRARDSSYDTRRQQPEISAEKQKLAASLFGGTTKSDRRQSSSTHKVSKTYNQAAADKSHAVKSTSETAALEKVVQPPPDLLDLGESSVSSAPHSVDPFKQLEGLIELGQDTSSLNSRQGSASAPELLSLYGETTLNEQSSSVLDPLSVLSGPGESNGHGANTGAQTTQQLSKGPNHKESLERDALVRQLGVTPTGQNPNLFRDLLG